MWQMDFKSLMDSSQTACFKLKKSTNSPFKRSLLFINKIMETPANDRLFTIVSNTDLASTNLFVLLSSRITYKIFLPIPRDRQWTISLCPKKSVHKEKKFFSRFWHRYPNSMLNFQNPGLFLLGGNEKLCKNGPKGGHVENTIFSKKPILFMITCFFDAVFGCY